MMCIYTELQDRIDYKHNALDKELLSEIIKKDQEIHELNKKVCDKNIKNAKLSIQSIVV